MSNIDWIKIKNEYINTNISYRKLAEKYSVSTTAISNRAKTEKWAELKKEHLNKTCTKVVQKTAEKIVKKESDRITQVLKLADKISPKIDKAIKQIETVLIGDEKIDVGMVDTYRLRQIIQSIKDLKDIVKVENTDSTDKTNKDIQALAELINNPQPNRNIKDFEEDE